MANCISNKIQTLNFIVTSIRGIRRRHPATDVRASESIPIGVALSDEARFASIFEDSFYTRAIGYYVHIDPKTDKFW